MVSRQSSVAVLIPHYRCEQWLSRSIESVTSQTRKPQAVIVIDDASTTPPKEIVQRYPSVTLVRARRNVGPYALIQQAIEETAFDAYMFQDADDWSGPRRLELLLEEGEESGAELIGCQEMRFTLGTNDAAPHYYHPHVRERMINSHARYPLLHPSSIVSRDLICRLGGFATGLSFGGDAEFLGRAIWNAHVTNIPYVCYFRRIRAGSLTTSPETERRSQQRTAHRERLAELTRSRAAAHARKEMLDLSPMSRASPIVLEHVSGPTLEYITEKNRRADIPFSDKDSRQDMQIAPILIIGELTGPAWLLYAALCQHPLLRPVAAASWIAGIQKKTRVLKFPEPSHMPESNWIDASGSYDAIVPELAARFPSARFIVVRSDEARPGYEAALGSRLYVLKPDGYPILSQNGIMRLFAFLGLDPSHSSAARSLRLLEEGLS